MSKFDRYALDSPRANPRSDGTAGGSGGPLWREVDGLLQKGFPAPPAKKDSKYPDPVYYLPYTPELDLDAENVRITPPKANENYLATTYIIDVGRQAMGISTIVPWDLRHLPVSAADFDSSIENSISPTKMNSNETGGLRWARKYFLLVMRVDGDRDPNPSVLMLGAQQMHEGGVEWFVAAALDQGVPAGMQQRAHQHRSHHRPGEGQHRRGGQSAQRRARCR